MGEDFRSRRSFFLVFLVELGGGGEVKKQTTCMVGGRAKNQHAENAGSHGSSSLSKSVKIVRDSRVLEAH